MNENSMKYIKEACVEGLQQALNAEKQGADRVELCARLDLDGLTPDIKTIGEVYEKLKVPIRVIVRPREGNFIYSDDEFLQMISSISACKEIGVEGVVFGITTEGNKLDMVRIKLLTNIAHPMKVTIHKAIDVVDNPMEALDALLNIEGITAVLTSGKGKTWQEGQNLIKEMINKAGNAIEIIACGKVTNNNIDDAHGVLQSRAYHGKLIVGKI
jgi:copper homeostasis protein